MAPDDKGQEYPCACGKVFRRKLALERHVDVHHSSGSLAHTCDVCGKTFGSRNTLTMHRSVHEKPHPIHDSPFPVGVSPTGNKDCESNTSCEMDFVEEEITDRCSPNIDHFDQLLDEPASQKVPIARDRLKTEPLEDPVTVKAEEEEIDIVSIMSEYSPESVSGLIRVPSPSESFLSDRKDDELASRFSVGLFGDQTLLTSGVLLANDAGTEQSVDISEMLVEEIVSESFQSSDQTSGCDSNLDWIESDLYSNASAANDLASENKFQTKCQQQQQQPSNLSTKTHASSCTGGSLFPQRRINKVKPETRRCQEKMPGPFKFPEIRVGVETIDELENQKEPAVRQQSSNRTQFTCGICHKNFDSEKYLSMHMPLHRPYYTDQADVKMPLSSVNHECPETQGGGGAKQKKTTMAAASELQQWTCQYCNKSFMQNSNYKNHMRTHSDERPFVCEICNIGFKERYHLKKHVLFKHTTDLKETCRVCGKCFKDSTAVRAHERIHSELRPYSCNLCGKTFKTSECLWHHENRSKTCGKSALRRNDDTAGAGNLLAAAVSSSPPTRRARRPRQSNPGSGTKLRAPRRSADAERSAMNGDDRQYLQVDQNGMFSNSEVEASVMSIKTEPDSDLFDPGLQTFLPNDQELENMWEILEYGTLNKDGSSTEDTGSDLTDSESCQAPKDYEDSGPRCSKGLECTKCVKKFSSAATFEKHMVMHSEERPYRCTLCDNGFKLKVHLKKHHLYRHSNEYPCECSICGKRFKDSSAVRLHEKIHSSDRPFRCHCGKGFKTRENLWGHKNRGPCDKTQDFIANNIRLFRSAEFGPILGVPITTGQAVVVPSSLGTNPITNASFVGSGGRTVTASQPGMQPVLLKTAQGVPHSVGLQFVPSCVLGTPELSVPGALTSCQLKVTTLKLVKSHSGDASTNPTSILPTAIVTPLLREAAPSSNPQVNIQTNSKPKSLPMDGSLPTTAIPPMKPTPKIAISCSSSSSSSSDVVSVPPTTSISVATPAPANGLRETVARRQSVAEKCPTVQKYLEMGSSPTLRFHGTNQLLGNSVISVNKNISNGMPSAPRKRQKLNSIGDDNFSTGGEYNRTNGNAEDFAMMDQKSQDSSSLPPLDPLLTNSPSSASYPSIYPGIEDYDDMKYDPNDPTLNIGDVYWGDSDNTLSSGWLLENESLFSDLSLTSTFGVL